VVILTYGADLIIATYTLAVAAVLVLVIRTRMPWHRGAILVVGLAILGYIAKETFVVLPTGPYRWDLLAAASLVIGLVLPSRHLD
jgi:hypothetical protein